jgi:integrase
MTFGWCLPISICPVRINNGRGALFLCAVRFEAAKANRHGHRDALMVLLAYRHGFRAAEVVDLRWGAGRFQNGYPARP